ncbi:hypothetical protein SAMN05428961_11375 [Paenibacillus sp. OK060]|uniref:hypothetical protein n=1 Tax=Paenibacillus sp. OK060 TaxID=1881034 RepID=UPI000891DCB8|nr:hypothetical protein [Paenibacillus sp. OK060]SDM31385.1 hypothetical protein SAMN05428961_11375 [Paenibacillus sp. OK060]
MQIFIFCMMGFLALMLVFLMIAKKRMDKNEPIIGWQRKQHLEEVSAGSVETQKKHLNKHEEKQLKKDRQDMKDLIGIEDIKQGIFVKRNNEYCVIVSTDSVNYDLLSAQARQSTILGYSSLFRVIRFPIQILGQAVRQDLRKEENRWKSNLEKCNSQTMDYNTKVINHIKNKSEKEFRISRKVYYVITYVPLPSKMGALKLEQREEMIRNELYQRAATVVGMLRQCEIHAELLDSLSAMEVMKRALNRDRMVINPIDDLVTHGREKLSSYITVDVTTMPGFEDLVYEVEEVRDYVQTSEKEASGPIRVAN